MQKAQKERKKIDLALKSSKHSILKCLKIVKKMYFYRAINLTYIYIFVMTLIRIYVSADPWITQPSHSVRSDPSDIERETIGRCKVRQDTRLPLAATDRRTLFRALVRTSLPCFGSSRTQIAHFRTRRFAFSSEGFGSKELAEIGSVKLDLWLFAAGFPETRLLQLGSS
jgi:hypothetical protein